MVTSEYAMWCDGGERLRPVASLGFHCAINSSVKGETDNAETLGQIYRMRLWILFYFILFLFFYQNRNLQYEPIMCSLLHRSFDRPLPDTYIYSYVSWDIFFFVLDVGIYNLSPALLFLSVAVASEPSLVVNANLDFRFFLSFFQRHDTGNG